MPIGKGILGSSETEAFIDFELFLAAPQGRAHYETLKGLGAIAQWSYGFSVLEASTNPEELAAFGPKALRILKRLDVHEASPVMLAAGEGTRTERLKSLDAKRALAPHDTPTTDEEWDAGAQVARLAGDAGAATLRKMYAWIDEEGDADTKAAFRFPHHQVSESGEVGAANVRGCVAGIAVLNGSRGGADIPDADRAGVHRHLAAHMMDAEMEPPELRAKSLRINDHVAHALRALPASIVYIEALTSQKDGRVLSGENLASLDAALTALDNAALALRELRARGIREESGDGKAALQRLIRDADLELTYRRLRAAV